MKLSDFGTQGKIIKKIAQIKAIDSLNTLNSISSIYSIVPTIAPGQRGLLIPYIKDSFSTKVSHNISKLEMKDLLTITCYNFFIETTQKEDSYKIFMSAMYCGSNYVATKMIVTSGKKRF